MANATPLVTERQAALDEDRRISAECLRKLEELEQQLYPNVVSIESYRRARADRLQGISNH